MADSRSNPPQQPVSTHGEWRVKVTLGVVLLLIVGWLYLTSSETMVPEPSPTGSSSPERSTARDSGDAKTVERTDTAAPRRTEQTRRDDLNGQASADDPLIVRNARVVDKDGRVIHRGDVDLRPTIERIERGKRLRFSHDGSVFENRERRLPIKTSGYYREFIHPTPDDDGPGGQRVVTGREGEIYYTPDHYKTFRRVR